MSGEKTSISVNNYVKQNLIEKWENCNNIATDKIGNTIHKIYKVEKEEFFLP